MLVLILMIYENLIYGVLGIILLVYFESKYHWIQIKWLILFFVILSLSLIPRTSFTSHLKGEVKAVLYNGIQVKNYLIEIDTTDFSLGDVIEADVTLQPYPASSNDGSFDEANYLKGKGIDYVVCASDISVIKQKFHLRNLALEYVEKNADERLKGIYLYLLLGNKTEDVTTISNMATELAIIHIFAISGMHFSILSSTLKKGLSYFMNETWANKVTLVLMGIYALCLEGNVAAWRTFLNQLLKAMGLKDELQRFSLIGLFFICIQPRIIFQLAFIYSFALYFLVIITKEMKHSSFFVYLGSMIISSYFQYEIAPIAFLFGFIFNGIMASLFPIFFIDMISGDLLSSFCVYLYEGLQLIMAKCSDLSFRWTVGKPNVVFVIAFYISYVYALSMWQTYQRKRAFFIPLSCIFLIIIYPYLNCYGEVVMLDVGQGDCSIIILPHLEEVILIDTGGLSYQDVATKRIIPFLKYKGIQYIDTLYITHQDFDHCGALESLKLNYNVKEVIEDFEENTHGNLIFKQLNPQIYDNENDNSLVIYTKIGGLEYLFTGDISEQVETDLLELYPNLDIDVLKVSHHGSKTSSSVAWISKLTPKISLISVGKNNLYGHPNRQVLGRLSAYGSLIYRTDTMGTCRIYFTETTSYIEIEE